MFGQFALADLELTFEIGVLQAAVQLPIAETRERVMNAGDRLPNEMNRSQPRHKNESGCVNPAEQNERADFAHGVEQHGFSQKVTGPAAGTLNVK